jgi:hypothetical protein
VQSVIAPNGGIYHPCHGYSTREISIFDLFPSIVKYQSKKYSESQRIDYLLSMSSENDVSLLSMARANESKNGHKFNKEMRAKYRLNVDEPLMWFTALKYLFNDITLGQFDFMSHEMVYVLKAFMNTHRERCKLFNSIKEHGFLGVITEINKKMQSSDIQKKLARQKQQEQEMKHALKSKRKRRSSKKQPSTLPTPAQMHISPAQHEQHHLYALHHLNYYHNTQQHHLTQPQHEQLYRYYYYRSYEKMYHYDAQAQAAQHENNGDDDDDSKAAADDAVAAVAAIAAEDAEQSSTLYMRPIIDDGDDEKHAHALTTSKEPWDFLDQFVHDHSIPDLPPDTVLNHHHSVGDPDEGTHDTHDTDAKEQRDDDGDTKHTHTHSAALSTDAEQKFDAHVDDIMNDEEINAIIDELNTAQNNGHDPHTENEQNEQNTAVKGDNDSAPDLSLTAITDEPKVK